MSHVLCVDTIDFNNLIANLEDTVIIEKHRTSVQQVQPTASTNRHRSYFTKIMKYLIVTNLTGTQVFHLQNIAIPTLRNNNLSNLCSSSLSLSAGDWLLKKKYCFHGAQVQFWWSNFNHKCAQTFHNITATSKLLAPTAWHKTTSKEPRNIRDHCKKFSRPGNPAHNLCTPAFGDSVYTCITYIQATINSSFRRPCTYTFNLHSSDHQQQL